MPGFVRAALPSALKVPGEKHTLGQELVVQVHQVRATAVTTRAVRGEHINWITFAKYPQNLHPA